MINDNSSFETASFSVHFDENNRDIIEKIRLNEYPMEQLRCVISFEDGNTTYSVFVNNLKGNIDTNRIDFSGEIYNTEFLEFYDGEGFSGDLERITPKMLSTWKYKEFRFDYIFPDNVVIPEHLKTFVSYEFDLETNSEEKKNILPLSYKASNVVFKYGVHSLFVLEDRLESIQKEHPQQLKMTKYPEKLANKEKLSISDVKSLVNFYGDKSGKDIVYDLVKAGFKDERIHLICNNINKEYMDFDSSKIPHEEYSIPALKMLRKNIADINPKQSGVQKI